MSIRGEAFAAIYDRVMEGAERAGLGEHRRRLLGGASGRVLEIGGGTGANLPFYREAVSELVIAEPERPMARRLRVRLRGYPIPARVDVALAEDLPLETASFDCGVATLVLCTVANLPRALGELRRVLKPNGRLLFIEHVRSDEPRIARWQYRLRRPWSWVAHGCQLDRATVDVMRSEGFSIAELRRDRLPKAPSFAAPLVVGVAVRSP
jgi:ubiquinone/menaquinone biosynthesis C-methylase UbiE